MRTSVIGGKANWPLLAASCTSFCAKATISSCGAVDEMTNSTGNVPALGNADGRNAGARTPVIPLSFGDSSSWMANMLRFRSSQGFTSMPPKPPVGNVTWKLWSYSGVEAYIFWTVSTYGMSCSTVAFAGASTAPKMTPWSSAGASSCGENM